MTVSEEDPLLGANDPGKEPPPEEHPERERHTEKRKVNMQKFLHSHEALVDRLSTVSRQQSQLMEYLVQHESERRKTTSDLTQLMKRIGDGLELKAEKKTAKLAKLEDLAKAKEEKSQTLRQIGFDVLNTKKKKVDQLKEIALNLKNLVPPKRETRYQPVYTKLPHVGVSLKIYNISNIDTASMMYEVDLTVMLDWEDENMRHVKDDDLKDLNYTEHFFNPSVIIENAKAGYDWLEGRDEVPRFTKLKKVEDEHGNKVVDPSLPDDIRDKCWMKKTQRFRGFLTIQEIKLETFPFDVQELPVIVKSKKCYIQLQDDQERKRNALPKTVYLVNNKMRQEVRDEEYQTALDESHYFGPKAPRRAAMGHWIAPAINDQLVEFQFRKVYGVSAFDDKEKNGDTNFTEDPSVPSSPESNSQSQDKLRQWWPKFLSFTWLLKVLDLDAEDPAPSVINAGRKQKGDSYKVSIIISRPVKSSSYMWDLLVMIFLVFLALTSFWDTAAPELSSRMSISLTIILTLAAYTSTRPPPIVKCPKLTFQDRYEVFAFMMVTVVSIMNVVSVTLCGGEHEESPQYMKETWADHQSICGVGWCHSRLIDCHFFLAFVFTFFPLTILQFLDVRQARLRLSPAVWASEMDEQRLRREERNEQLMSSQKKRSLTSARPDTPQSMTSRLSTSRNVQEKVVPVSSHNSSSPAPGTPS